MQSESNRPHYNLRMINGPCLVTVSGPIGHGKSSVARALEAGYGFQTVSMADGLKSALDDLAGMSRDLLKEGEIRPKWRTLGTESREEAGVPDTWIDVYKTKLAYLQSIGKLRVVTPDIRYLNEDGKIDSFCHDRGIHMIRVRVYNPDKPVDRGHSSEMQWDQIPYDHLIVNDGTLVDLCYEVFDRIGGESRGL